MQIQYSANNGVGSVKISEQNESFVLCKVGYGIDIRIEQCYQMLCVKVELVIGISIDIYTTDRHRGCNIRINGVTLMSARLFRLLPQPVILVYMMSHSLTLGFLLVHFLRGKRHSEQFPIVNTPKLMRNISPSVTRINLIWNLH